jgi:hypothetical protein
VLLYYIGLIFWTCLGLVLFQRLVRTALEDDPRTNRIAAAVTLGMWPATTLCYYTFSAMAHVAAFTASVVFLLSWWKAKTSTAWALWFGCGAALGVLSLCRWQDFLFVAVPIVHDLQRRLRRDLTFDRSWLLSRAAAVAGFTVVFWPQLVQWKSVYGAWLAMPRGATVLEFPPQHVMHALVSTQHGWFVWTPAAALGLAGLIWSCRMSRVAPALLAAVVCEVWLVGALQENWDGHVAFGMRYLTSTCSLLGLGLALAMARVAPRVRLATLALASACAAFTLVFGVQYRLDLLPKRDRLTVDELVADKLHLRRAVRRSRAVMEAKQLLDEGRPAEAAARIEFAKQAFGEGRDILQAQAAAYARLGDGPRRMAAQAELDRLLASRLF